MIPDRRVAALRPISAASSPRGNMSPQAAATDKEDFFSTLSHDMTPRTAAVKGHEQLLSLMDTPVRECVRDIIMNIQPDTPETKRRRREEDPEFWDTPECAKASYMLAQKREFLEARRTRNLPTESEKKNKKPSTVSV